MFETAIKAVLPIVGVKTDDPINFETVLRYYFSGKVVSRYTKGTKSMALGPYAYWTEDPDLITVDTYEKFRKSEHTLVVQNYTGDSPLVFDAGVLPTPEFLVRQMLEKYVGKEWVERLAPVLRGLSLRAIREVLVLTQARAGNASPFELRRTRASLFGATQGLYLENTSYDFYVWPGKLKAWLELNKPYFSKAVHPKLVPRGLMFEGPPGVGKSMAAKAIANAFEVPLYRFDIASALDKYVGVSENRVAKNLALVDREAPCVLLLDEVEKIFQGKEDAGVINRLLSLLLWWLAERQSRVFVVMTTNKRAEVPPELYRKGRIDSVVSISPLTYNEAVDFAHLAFENVVSKKPTAEQHMLIIQELRADLPSTHYSGPFMVHADVEEIIYNLVKQNGWALKDLTNIVEGATV